LIKMCHINTAIKAAGTAGIPEKKTPDGNISAPKAPASPVLPQSAPASSPAAPPPAHSGNAAPLDKDAVSTLSAELKLGLKRADKISLDLSAFDKAVKVEQAEMAQRESRLSIENIKIAWGEYAAKVDSPSLRQAFNSAVLRLDEKLVIASVGLSIQSGLLQSESSRLLDYLRQQMQDIGVKMKVQIDESLAPAPTQQRPVRALTNKEKLEKLKETNPAVNDLLSRFDLKLED
jgi:hypothetical protein